ncbi:MAG TPA: LysM peptidoglycan-binding domain-containing protein [Gemmatimonadaceae bacterium]|nr:LysM peptidoglycan-binding domain-containing protein [Gemmatimonadaceae bacterium]
MGIFDKKPGSADFSDTKGASSSNSSSSADFSDVSGGASSSAPSAGSAQSYTVKSGDSLSKIAKHVYGDGSKWHRIYEANRDKIKNPDMIQPGWELTIPSE